LGCEGILTAISRAHEPGFGSLCVAVICVPILRLKLK
jgi:deoxyribose-phosphate aldolase